VNGMVQGIPAPTRELLFAPGVASLRRGQISLRFAKLLKSGPTSGSDIGSDWRSAFRLSMDEVPDAVSLWLPIT